MLEGELTRADFVRFMRYRRGDRSPHIRPIISVAVFLAVVVLRQLDRLSSEMNTYFWILGAITALGLTAHLFVQVVVPRWVERQPGCLGHKVFTIRHDGLHEQNSVGEILLKWESILKIEQKDSYVFVFVSPKIGFAIPQRFAPSKTAFDEAVARMREEHAAAQTRS